MFEALPERTMDLRQNSWARAFLRVTATSHEPGCSEKMASAANWATPRPRCFRKTKNSPMFRFAGSPEWVSSLTREKPARAPRHQMNSADQPGRDQYSSKG